MDKKMIMKQLESIAYQISQPFCYGCYKTAPTGQCKLCGSDDLMRVLDSVGCEYGTDWIIEHLISEKLTSIDEDEIFESMMEDCYPETTEVGFLELDTITIMKDQDPIAWSIAKSEHIDALETDKELLTFDNGSNYYWMNDIEILISEYAEAA